MSCWSEKFNKFFINKNFRNRGFLTAVVTLVTENGQHLPVTTTWATTWIQLVLERAPRPLKQYARPELLWIFAYHKCIPAYCVYVCCVQWMWLYSTLCVVCVCVCVCVRARARVRMNFSCYPRAMEYFFWNECKYNFFCTVWTGTWSALQTWNWK